MLSTSAKEALIESARAIRRGQMVRFKAQIAGHSGSMGKICNAEAEHLDRWIAAHDSIRASLTRFLSRNFDAGIALRFIPALYLSGPGD